MSNTILTPTVIANELLMRFQNNLGFAKNVDHEYDDKFAQEGAKIGDTYTLRKPVKFLAVDGPDITSSIQDVTETSTTLVLNQYKSVPFKFAVKDLTLNIDRFSERYLKSASVALANSADVVGLTAAYQACPNIVGTPGTTPSAAKTYLQAGEKLDSNSAPLDDGRIVVINPRMQTEIVDSLKGLFVPSATISNQTSKGRMGGSPVLGFNWFMDQNIRTHTVGAYVGTPLSNGATQTGASIVSDGWTGSVTGLLKKGDIVTFGTLGASSAVLAVNPVSGDTLDYLAQFVVTADVNSTTGAATIPIYPAVTATGAYKTASQSIPDNATITVIGTTAISTPQALAFHKEAFVFGMAPLMMPNDVHFKGRATDPDTGMSVRIVSQYNVLTDEMITRADILFGFGVRRPEWACRIAG